MKKRIIVLVDGENVSYKRADEITAISHRLGKVVEQKVYHRQKDQITRPWTEKTNASRYKDICLIGGPEKDKVDLKMQKDARQYMQKPDIDMVCVVTSDGGFDCLADAAHAAGKQLCFIGEKKASKKLRTANAKFIQLTSRDYHRYKD